MITKLPEIEESAGDSGFVRVREGVLNTIVEKMNEIIEELNKKEE